jgi:hypothetical protein
MEEIISKKYVHKGSDDNIFLYTLQRAIPNYIKKDVFEKILSMASHSERELLINNYLPLDVRLQFLENCEYYVLCSIMSEIDKKIFYDIIDGLSDNQKQKEIDFIKTNYREEKDRFVLIHELSDTDEIKILNLLNKKDSYVNRENKYELFKLFEKFDFVEKKDIFRSTMYVDTCHEFFFEHSNDHVPGIMVIEAVRQMVIACCHTFGYIPFEGYHMMIDLMNASFSNFLELQYPIYFEGVLKTKKLNNLGHWSHIEMEISIIQNLEKAAAVTIVGTSINDKLYNRIRGQNQKNLIRYRFIPFNKYKYEFYLHNPQSNKYYSDISLGNISMNGFKLQVMNDNNFDRLDLYNFYLYFNNHKMVQGKCRLIWENKNGDSMDAGFQIVDISEEDSINLKNSILRFCILYESREIL